VKKFVFIIAILAGCFNLKAQYCGFSGGFACTAIDSTALPGYSPASVFLHPFINNLLASTTIQFTAFDSLYFGTEILYVYSTTIDSINNLPAGLCWTTDQDSNKYGPGQIGCVKIEGIPCDYTGQYKVPTILTLQISGGTNVVTDGDAAGMQYFIRLNNPGDAFYEVDTTQTDSTPFLYYGGICTPLDTLKISTDTGGNVCNGSIVYLTPQVSGGQPPYSFRWQWMGNSLNCDTCQYPHTTISTNSIFALTVTDFNGNVAYDTINYTVTGPPYNFQINAAGPTVYCDSGIVALFSQPGVAAGYQWYYNNTVLTGATDSLYTDSSLSGAFYLQYSLPGCMATSNIISLSFFNATPAVIIPLGGTQICQGNPVVLLADSMPGLSYQWIYNNSTIQSLGPLDSINAPGNYQLAVINTLGCADTSAALSVTSSAGAAPIVTFDYYNADTLCLTDGPFSLIGGSPPGGNYYGAGVWGNIFYPDSAVTGENIISYIYVDSNNCSATATDTVFIENCTGVGIVNASPGVIMYPNPAGKFLNIVSDILNTNKCSINLFNAAGGSVAIDMGQVINGNKITLDISLLPAGLYYVQLTANNQVVRGSFIKLC
jgi:Secretion system C-terminal sorting domain